MPLTLKQATNRICFLAGISPVGTVAAPSGLTADMVGYINDARMELFEKIDSVINQKLWAIRLLAPIDHSGDIAGTTFTLDGAEPGNNLLGDNGVAPMRQDYTHAKIKWDGGAYRDEFYEIASVTNANEAEVVIAKDEPDGGLVIVQDYYKAPPDLEAFKGGVIMEKAGTSKLVHAMSIDELRGMRAAGSGIHTDKGTPVRATLFEGEDITYSSVQNVRQRWIIVDPVPDRNTIMVIHGTRKLLPIENDDDLLGVDRQYEGIVIHRAAARTMRDRRDETRGMYWEMRYEERFGALRRRMDRTQDRASIEPVVLQDSAGQIAPRG